MPRVAETFGNLRQVQKCIIQKLHANKKNANGHF